MKHVCDMKHDGVQRGVDRSRRMSVIIPTHRRPQLLQRTLSSLQDCKKPSGYHETVVIENGCQSGAEDIVKRCPRSLNTRYMYARTANKSHALNEALETAADGLIIFTDDDVRLHQKTLTAYADAARSRHEGFFYGGPTRVDYEQAPSSWLLPFLPASASRIRDVIGGIQQPPFLFLGFNWAAFKCDIEAAGGFDSAFGPGSPTGAGGQETELQRRLLAHGVEQVYVDEAVVWHYVPKERCSVSWILQRQFATGIAEGQRAKNGSSSVDLRHGAQYLRNLAIDHLRCVKYLWSLDKERSFEMAMRCSRHIGRLRGYYTFRN